MKNQLCQFGNCQEMKAKIRINTGEERKSFCCDEHAAYWLLNRAICNSRYNAMRLQSIRAATLRVSQKVEAY